MAAQDFARTLIAWQKTAGRHGLPWMVPDAYRRWLSEVMLQQTQVSVVREYFARFLEHFPTVEALAAAEEKDVMRLWAGLGYYARARNLHACAREVVARFGGEFPQTVEELVTLPGIGRSTAGAIASFAWEVPAPILDGNVKRVFARVDAVALCAGTAAFERALWAKAEERMAQQEPGVYNQALMDLGATVCTRTRPRCGECPVAGLCRAHAEGWEEAYPVKKPRTTRKPERSRILLLALCDGAVYLERREGKGVWRGLMSLPETDVPPEGGRLVGNFDHEFSHYRLHAQIWLTDEKNARRPGGGWVRREDVLSEPLPAPLKLFFEDWLAGSA